MYLIRCIQEWGLSASDHNLSVGDKQNKLRKQLEELDKSISQETKAKEGLENLVRFYSNDPVAQKKAEDQTAESAERIQRLQEIRATVDSQYLELGGESSAAASYSGVIVKVRGLYDYAATCDTELTFKEGEILTITEQDDSGWWYATNASGIAGFIPNNYVELVN